MRSPAETGEEQIRRYLLHMVEERKISRETYRQIQALKAQPGKDLALFGSGTVCPYCEPARG